MKRPLPRLWLITDRLKMQDDLIQAIEQAVAAVPPGFAGIILREKDLEARPLLDLARLIRDVTDAPLVINGRLDVALACDADGVHLGGDAPAFAAVRPLLQDLLVGVSLHSEELPPDGADYALLSPIFATTSKPGVTPLGIPGLRSTCARTPVPIFALGGITSLTAPECLQAGAAGLAVREAVLLADDPAGAARSFLTS